jgi:hypothetical protein
LALSAFVQGLEAQQARHDEHTAKQRRAWEPEALLFLAQIQVWRDRRSPRIVVDCSRRSGKSYVAAVLLIDLSLEQDGHNALYLTQSSEDTREIIWRLVVALNDEYQLGGETNETRLEITFPNGSFVRFAGCKDHAEARRRIKGRRWHFVIIDEGQNFPDYLEMMVEAGLIPTLMGKGGKGRIMMMGTPSEIPGIGYYEKAVLEGGWTVYHWTIRENEALDQAEVEAYLAERAAKLGPTSAIHLREDLGERPAPDASSGLVYTYARALNDPSLRGYLVEVVATENGTRYDYPDLTGRWHVGIGMDLGFARDHTAMVAIGVNEDAPGMAFLLEEFLAPLRLQTPGVAARLEELIERWVPEDIRCDEGALGVQLADQLRGEPFSLPVNPAEKLHELAQADALNTALVTGRLLLSPSSRAAADMGRVRWDPKYRERGKRKEALRPHSDVLPSCRYIWPLIYSLLDSVKRPKPRPTEHELEMRDALQMRKKRNDRQGWRSW